MGRRVAGTLALVGACCAALLILSCSVTSHRRASESPGTLLRATGTPPGQRAAQEGPLPAETPPPADAPRHLFVVLMENHEYEQIVGSDQAPYVNQLAQQYALADHYYAVSHPSLPNYLALLGGDTFGRRSNCTGCFVDGPSLVDQLEAHDRTWKSYQEGLPAPCFLQPASEGYVVRHDPFLYFRTIRDDPARCQRVVPLSQLQQDLRDNHVPEFVWVTPDVRHDMHDGSVAEGDRWLTAFVPDVLNSPAWREGGLLFIVWDEGQTNAGCCGAIGGGHVPLLVISPHVQPGARWTAPANHYALLRTIQELWGLGSLRHTGDAGVRPLLGLFDVP